MGKLADLISSGIELAIEAKSSYQSPQGNKDYNKDVIREQSYNNPTRVSRHPSLRELPFNDNERAQQDLRNYVDYQNSLADCISADVRRDEKYRRYLTAGSVGQLRKGVHEKDVSFYDYELPSDELRHTGGLSQPVIIPQRWPEDESCGILRAYAPALGDCGIDQETFLDFIDAFNEAHKSSLYLDAINVAVQGVGFAPGIAPLVVSITVPVAVQAAKGYQTKRQSTSFLDRANEQIFKPHGLFAMVLIYNPSQAQNSGLATEVQLPNSASLIYPQDERRMQQTDLKKMGHPIADYGDKRAQARYASAYKNRDSALISGPAPTFKSRWGDPNHPANRSGLKTLLTGVPDDKNDHERGIRNAKDRRRRSSSDSGRGGLLSTAMEAVGGDRRTSGGRPGLIGGLRGMIAGPGKENQSLIKTAKGLGMKTDILYLMITNDTDDPPSAVSSMNEALYQSPRHAHLQTHRDDQVPVHSSVLPYSATNPDQVSSNQNNSPYTSHYSVTTPPSNEQYDGPPPAYREAMTTHYYDRVRENWDYCVPTI